MVVWGGVRVCVGASAECLCFGVCFTGVEEEPTAPKSVKVISVGVQSCDVVFGLSEAVDEERVAHVMANVREA